MTTELTQIGVLSVTFEPYNGDPRDARMWVRFSEPIHRLQIDINVIAMLGNVVNASFRRVGGQDLMEVTARNWGKRSKAAQQVIGELDRQLDRPIAVDTLAIE